MFKIINVTTKEDPYFITSYAQKPYLFRSNATDCFLKSKIGQLVSVPTLTKFNKYRFATIEVIDKNSCHQ